VIRRRLRSVGFMVAVLGMWVIQCGDDGPCDPDPCAERNALPGTCQWYGIGDYWCDCMEGAEWKYGSNACEGVVDRCVPDPCRIIAHAPAGTCVDEGDGDFSCDCDPGFVWNGGTNTCAVDPCDPDPCEGIAEAVAGTCVFEGGGDFSCDCDPGFEWDDDVNACAVAIDACDPDPCEGIAEAVAGTCVDEGFGDFSCDCNLGFLWNGGTNTCAEVGDPCDPDPCEGIAEAVAGTCDDLGGGDFECDCDLGFAWRDGSNTCLKEGVPEFPGGSYEMRATDIEQDPGGCLLSPAAVNLVRPIMRQIVIPVFIASGEVIVNVFGNAYPLDINLPVFGTVTVDISLDGTYENMLMDGPDVYVADTSGLVPGADCVITGSADGIFTDINDEPLTGSLTIDIDRVQDSPPGVCTLLKKPTERCAITVNLNAGSPL